ncbi:MAG: hypothetical protein J2P37_08025 [Ktedonobacteraceae bacterium]|nr:hypothetical protein [Ktedonobacteraceae bacterium]MBO0790755.1 hypothetical protein [Ktedonobacteraceae bacterium]
MAQRTVINNDLLDERSILWEAMRLLSTIKGLRLVWSCDVCGMIYLDANHPTCESCGATRSLSLHEDTRPEIHSRA